MSRAMWLLAAATAGAAAAATAVWAGWTTDGNGEAVARADTLRAPVPTVDTRCTGTSGEVAIRWRAVEGAAEYELSVGDDVGTVTGTATTLTFAGLGAGSRSIHVRVRSVRLAWRSPQSAPMTVTVGPCVEAPPAAAPSPLPQQGTRARPESASQPDRTSQPDRASSPGPSSPVRPDATPSWSDASPSAGPSAPAGPSVAPSTSERPRPWWRRHWRR